MHRLSTIQSVSKFRASLSYQVRIYSINIKRYMKRMLVIGIQIFNSLSHDLSYAIFINMVHCKKLNPLSFIRFILIWINISNSYLYNIFWIQKWIIIKPSPIIQSWNLGYSSKMRKRHSMIIWIWNWFLFIIRYIRMSINPYYFQILIMSSHSGYGCSCNRMISSNCQQKIIFFLLDYLVSFLVQSAHIWSQNVQIFNRKLQLRVFCPVLMIDSYISIIIDINPINTLQSSKNTCLSDDLWCFLNTLNTLSFTHSCAKISQILKNCLFTHIYPLQVQLITKLCLQLFIIYKLIFAIIFIDLQNSKNMQEQDMNGPFISACFNKIHPIILIIDNREHYSQHQNNNNKNFSSSGFKQTEVDPLQFGKSQDHFSRQFDLINQLQQRVTKLQKRVKSLEAQDFFYDGGVANRREKKKNRRKFTQLARDHECGVCNKIYGSETALKNHLKIKHRKQQDIPSGHLRDSMLMGYNQQELNESIVKKEKFQ